jgi:hypothetical protein
MKINLSSEQEQIIKDELKSGHFRSAEDVIARALAVLREKKLSSPLDGPYDDAVRRMLDFVEMNRTPLRDVSVKELIHEGHPL